ncbi:MAG: methyltransferase [Candidatus Aenigmatarchaeota archaeon]
MPEHYFTKSPCSKGPVKIITALINGATYKFATTSGIFSKDRVDKGTMLLVESVRINKGDKILDIGCGYGVIGIVFAKQADSVIMTDVNERAVEFSKTNVKLNNLDNISVIESDLYENVKGAGFDKVVCNPPIRAGKNITIKIIEGAKSHLAKGGKLFLVARTNQGAKSIAKRMREKFGNETDINRHSGYRVMLSVKMDQD